MPTLNKNGLNEYQRVKNELENISPLSQVNLLYQGLIQKLNNIKVHINEQNHSKKGEEISKTITVLSVLQGSVDLEQGGEVAENLDALYDYLIRRLSDANVQNIIKPVDEVIEILSEVGHAWSQIAEQEN